MASGGGAGSGSYYEEYMRSNALLKHGHEKNAKKLLTDRNAYISFLEVQLERVSAACLTTQSFDKRLGELESVQSAQDQKLGSLSKVFRLSQEYIEQSAEQTRSDVAGLDAKWSAWMDKYSHEIHAQQARVDTAHEQLRGCEDFLQRLAEQTQSELQGVRATVEQELEDLRTLVFTLETRLEGMQNSSVDTDKHLEFLKDLVTDRFDKARPAYELDIVRTSVSDKCFTMDGKLKRLSDTVERLPEQLETSWRADVVRLESSRDDTASELRACVERVSQQQTHDHDELKHVLRKCLDTQHLLSATVVALQREVDDQRQSDTAAPELARVVAAVDDVRENQHKLADALRVMQSCTQSAQVESAESCSALAQRLRAAEETFARLTDDSLARADDLRSKMLVALSEVEQKLRQDADFVAEQAVRSVRVESECQFKQMMEFTAAMENRLRILERGVTTLEANVCRSRIVSDVLGEANRSDERHGVSDAMLDVRDEERPTAALRARHHDDDDGDDNRELTAQQRSRHHVQREAELQSKIRELEDRLVRKAQSNEEELRAAFASHRSAQPSAASLASASESSASSSCARPRSRRPLATSSAATRDSARNRAPPVMATKSVKTDSSTVKTATKDKTVVPKQKQKKSSLSAVPTSKDTGASGLSTNAAKSKALRELCMELVSLEASAQMSTRKRR